MIVDTLAPVLDYEGAPMVLDEGGTVVTYRFLIWEALNAHIPDRSTPDEKYECFVLCAKVIDTEDGHVDLSDSERNLIRVRSGLVHNPLAVGRLRAVLEA